MSTTQLSKQENAVDDPQNEEPALEGFKRPDGPWSWIVCGLFTLSHLLAFGCVLTYGILFPSIMNEFKSGRALTAIPGSLGSSIGLFGPIVGPLCDHLGGRKGMLMAGLCCVCALLVSAFAPSIILLVIFYGIGNAIGLGFVHFSAVVSISLYFKRRSFEAITLICAGPTSGLVVMTPIVQQLNKNFGWRNALKFMSAFTTVLFVTSALMRPPKKNKPASGGQTSSSTTKMKNVCRYLVDFSALKIKAFVLAAFSYSVYTLGQQMTFVHLGKFCDDIGISSEKSSWLYFTIGASTLSARLLVAKFGKAPCWSLGSILLIGIILLSVGNFLLSSLNQYYWLVVYCIGFGVSDGFVNSSVVNIVMGCMPASKSGGGVGLLYFICSISSITGPILSGFIADVSGSYNVAFYTAGGLLVLAIISCLSLRCSSSPSSHHEEILERFNIEEVLFIERETVL